MDMKNRILMYGVVAVVVAVAVGFAVLNLIPNNASLKLSLYTTNYTTVYPYQTSYFYIFVNNTGNSQVNNLLVGFYLNGANLKYYTVSVPAHNHVLLGANYTYLNNGTYSFQAIADPGHVFTITNRSSTQQSVDIQVLKTQSPNVYTSIPNKNITSTQSFTFSSAGTLSTAAIADKYNITSLNNMFFPDTVMPAVFENLYSYVSLTNGAFAMYSNNTTAYTAWMQGTSTPVLVNYVLASYHLPQNTVSVNGTKIYFTKLNNQTSICTFYQKGWTKIVSYSNDSLAGTCEGISATSYTPIESNALVAALKNSTTLTHYQSGFTYTNSSQLGTAISLSGSGSLGAMNIFQNNYGFFISLVKSMIPSANITNSTGKCVGLIANNKTSHICSTYILPRTGAVPKNYSLINTTMLTDNYSFDLYSLVNVSNLFSAHYNGAALLEAMKVNQSTQRWSTGFTDSCGFNVSIGCKVNNFNYSTNVANYTLTNNYAAPVRLNTAACYMPGVRHNSTIAQTLGAGAKYTGQLACYAVPFGYASAITSYLFALNYTVNGTAATAYGSMNITNFGG